MAKELTPVERAALAYTQAWSIYEQAQAALGQAWRGCVLAKAVLDMEVDKAVLEHATDRAKKAPL